MTCVSRQLAPEIGLKANFDSNRADAAFHRKLDFDIVATLADYTKPDRQVVTAIPLFRCRRKESAAADRHLFTTSKTRSE